MRLLLTIAYDGAAFDGWQSQASGNAVQDHLEKAFGKVLGAQVRVHGAGRTDAGVHAYAQRAHVDVTECRVPLERLPFALNDSLPYEVRVETIREVSSKFHARFDARGKIYEYRLWNDRFFHPLQRGRAWHVPHPIDLEKFRACADLLTGRHDYAGFAANRGKPEEDTVRTIHRMKVLKEGRLLRVQVEGDGFLYRMVRLLVGSMVRVGTGKAEFEWLQAVLLREKKTHFCAPAEGLFLLKIKY